MAKKVFKSLLADVHKQKDEQISDIKHLIKIEKVFKDLIPPLNREEFEQLEENILAEGCRESLLIWERADAYVLIDGHNRYQICQKHGIEFKISLLAFENEEKAKLYIINNQLGRRNLGAEQASYLRGLRYLAEKKGYGGNRNPSRHFDDLNANENSSRQNVDLKTTERLSKEFNVSAKTIERDAQFAKAIDKIGEVNPDLRKEILSGVTNINKSQIQEIAKMDALPHLENIQDLENLFLSKAEKAKKEILEKTKIEVLKERLSKVIKSTVLTETEKSELREYFEKLIQ